MRTISTILIIVNIIVIFDFYYYEVVRREIFEEFDCKTYLVLLKSGNGSNCDLVCKNGNKIYLPNNVTFEENFKKGDIFKIYQTGFLKFNKRIEFIYNNEIVTEKVSNLYSNYILFFLFASTVFNLLNFIFYKKQIFQILSGLFITLNVVILFFYIYLH